MSYVCVIINYLYKMYFFNFLIFISSTVVFTVIVTVVLSVNQTSQLEQYLLETINKTGTQFKPPFTVRHSTRFGSFSLDKIS